MPLCVACSLLLALLIAHEPAMHHTAGSCVLYGASSGAHAWLHGSLAGGGLFAPAAPGFWSRCLQASARLQLQCNEDHASVWRKCTAALACVYRTMALQIAARGPNSARSAGGPNAQRAL